MAHLKVLNQKNTSAIDTRLALAVYGGTTVMLSPSVSSGGGVTKYTYTTFDRISLFPTNQSGTYNPEVTYINFQTGDITGGYTVSTSFTPTIPTAGNSIACAIQLDDQDLLYFNYGVVGTLAQVQAAVTNFTQNGSAGSIYIDKSKALIWIVILSSTDGVNISALANTNLVDCRTFFTENKIDTQHALMVNTEYSIKNEDLLVQDVAANASSCTIMTNSQGIMSGDQVYLQANGPVSSSVYANLYPFGDGSYNIRPASDPGSAKVLTRTNGVAFVLGTDYNYGDNLLNDPVSGNKIYGSTDGITIFDKDINLLSLEPNVTAFARSLSGYASFVPDNYELSIDPATGYIKFGTQLIAGDGRSGALNLSTPGTYSLNESIGGTTYCRLRKVTNQIFANDTSLNYNTIQYTGTDIAVNVGDYVMVYVGQSNVGNTGTFDLVQVESAVAGSSITIHKNISSGGDGFVNNYNGAVDNVWVMTVPQFLSVTIGNGVTLTCDQWTDTTGGGMCVFACKTTLTCTGTGIIDVSGKGYRGATSVGAKGEGFLLSSYNVVSNTTSDAGGGGGAPGVAGSSGTAATLEQSGVNFSAEGGESGGSGGTAGGSGGGGGYGTTGGAGGLGGSAGAGGGAGGATSVTTGYPAGTASGGGVGDSATSAHSGLNGGASGTAVNGGLNSPGPTGAVTPGNGGTGGASGESEGTPQLPQLFMGGGGGAAGGGANGGAGAAAGGTGSNTPGGGGGGGGGNTAGTNGTAGAAIGGNGGGIIYIIADTVSGLNVKANGANGVASTGIGGNGGNASNGAVSGQVSPLQGFSTGGNGAGAGGGGGSGGGAGAGGTILVATRAVSSVTSVLAQGGTGGAPAAAGTGGTAGSGAINSFATAGGGGPGGNGYMGSTGGNGAVGRVRLNYYYYNSLFYPHSGNGVGAFSVASPAGYLGETTRLDQGREITATFNFVSGTSDFNTIRELLTVQSTTSTTFFGLPVTQVNFKTNTQKAYAIANGAKLQYNASEIALNRGLRSYRDRIVFDSGLIAASAGQQVTGKRHGVNYSSNQYTPLILIYSASFTNLDNVAWFWNAPFKNNTSVYGVWFDVGDTTYNYTIGKDGLYVFPGSPASVLNSGYIRILFVLA